MKLKPIIEKALSIKQNVIEKRRKKKKNKWNGLSISGNEKWSFYTTIVNKIINKNVHLRGKFPESGSCHVSQPDHVSNYVQVVSTFDMGEEEGTGYGVTDHQAYYANIAEEESDQSPGPVHDPLAPRFPPPFSSLSAADPITSTLPISIGSRIPSYVESSIPFHHSSGTRLLKISLALFLFLFLFFTLCTPSYPFLTLSNCSKVILTLASLLFMIAYVVWVNC